MNKVGKYALLVTAIILLGLSAMIITVKDVSVDTLAIIGFIWGAFTLHQFTSWKDEKS